MAHVHTTSWWRRRLAPPSPFDEACERAAPLLEAALPFGLWRYSVWIRGGWIPARFRDSAHPKLLTARTIALHMAGRITVAAAWSTAPFAQVDHFVVDLDNHDEEADPFDVHRRAARVRAALGELPHLTIRSSRSRGLHLYYFLEEKEYALETGRLVAAALARGGVDLKPGHVELWPQNSALRLPLGSGSCVIDRETFEPIGARASRAGSLLRDPAAGAAYLDAFARRNRFPLKELLGGPMVASAEPGASSRSVEPDPVRGPVVGGSKGRGPLRGEDYRSDVAASEAGITGPGRRRDQARRRLFDLRVRQGLGRQEALRRFRDWLEHGDHHSKDLRWRRARTVRQMERDAARYLDHLERGIRAGRLRPGSGSTYSLLLLVHGAGWRELAVAALTAADEALLASEPDPWLRAKLRVLLGCLRVAQREAGTSSFALTMGAAALKRVTGNKPHPARKKVTAPDGSETWSHPHPAVMLVAWFEELGVVRRLDRGVRGRRGSLFAVSLPAAGAGGAAEAAKARCNDLDDLERNGRRTG